MPKPFFQNELVKLYCGDCLEIIGEAEDSFDVCLTDPPYFVLPKGKGEDRFEWDSFKSKDDFLDFTRRWLSLIEAHPSLRILLSFWSAKHLNDGFSVFNPSRLALWRHPNLINVGGMNDFAYDYEPILVKYYGKPC